MFQNGADRRHGLGQHKGQPAQRIDRFLHLGKARINQLGDIVKLGAGIAIPHAITDGHDQFGGGFIMLVLDLADDFLDQILDGDEPVGAGKFIQHHRQMHSPRAHIGQHIQRAARLRHIKRLAHQHRPVGRRGLAGRKVGEDILDVDHPDHIIQPLTVNGHPRMAMFGEHRDQFIPRNRRIHRNDLAARHGDIIGIMFGKMQQIAQHLPFERSQIAFLAGFGWRGCAKAVFVLVLVNRFFELFAQGTRAFTQPQSFADRRPQPAATVRISCG